MRSRTHTHRHTHTHNSNKSDIQQKAYPSPQFIQCLKHSTNLILPPLLNLLSRHTCSVTISKMFFTAMPTSECVCVCYCKVPSAPTSCGRWVLYKSSLLLLLLYYFDRYLRILSHLDNIYKGRSKRLFLTSKSRITRVTDHTWPTVRADATVVTRKTCAAKR